MVGNGRRERLRRLCSVEAESTTPVSVPPTSTISVSEHPRPVSHNEIGAAHVDCSQRERRRGASRRDQHVVVFEEAAELARHVVADTNGPGEFAPAGSVTGRTPQRSDRLGGIGSYGIDVFTLVGTRLHGDTKPSWRGVDDSRKLFGAGGAQ